MDYKEQNEYAAELRVIERQREKTPVAFQLQERCHELMAVLTDEGYRKDINELILELGHIIRSGRDVDTENWRATYKVALEKIAQAEATLA